jgi:signal transduction histidine kinase
LLPAHSHLPKRSLLFFAAGLFLLSFLSNWYFASKPSIVHQQKLLQNYVNAQQGDANELLKDSVLMRKLVQGTESLQEFEEVAAKQYGLFLFAETASEKQEPLFWNNQKILPPAADFSLADGYYFQQLLNGFYIIEKRALQLEGMSNNLVAYVLIPVLYKYYLPLDYLPTQFAHDKDAVKQIVIVDTTTAFPITIAGGRPLFYINKIAQKTIKATDFVTIFLRVGAFVLLLVYVQLITESIRRRGSVTRAILFLSLVLLFFRTALFYYPGLLSLRQFPLFDPSIYASNFLNRSLGDLLLNAIVLCWCFLFAWRSIDPKKRLPSFIKKRGVLAAGIVCSFILILSTFQLANVVHQLVTSSKISFNVTDFFSLDKYTVFGFIVLALVSLTYYYFSQLLFRVIQAAFPNLLLLYFIVAVIGLLFLTLRSNEVVVLFHLPVLAWLVAYTLLLSKQEFIINRFAITIAGILFWIFIFSASLALLILQGNKETEWRSRKGLAEKYDERSDPSNERKLSIALTYLDNRFLKANFSRFRDEKKSHVIRDSIITESFTDYINQYDTKIYVFDSANQPLNNGDDDKSYGELNVIVDVQSRPTGIQDLYYHETPSEKFAYITRRIIDDSTGITGTFFLLSTPKQYQNADAFYIVFFRKVATNDPENSPTYSHAVYIGNKLRSHSSKYPFTIEITDEQIPENVVERRVNGGYDELWYRAKNKKVIIVSKEQDSLLESITLFSWLFCAFIFMVGIIQVFGLLVRLWRDWRTAGIFSKLNIRTQIHGTVIFISVLSFFIIGAATIEFFISRYKRDNIDRLSRTASITVNEMNKQVKVKGLSTAPFDFSDSASLKALKGLIKEIADVHNVDVNLYDLKGNLQVSSYEPVYNRGILSLQMNPRAYYHLAKLREVQRVQDETTSSLDYLNIYSVVRDDKGNIYAYLNVPYFSSEIDLKQEISNFLVTIINLNAFIFLIAGVVALFITNRITRSFSIIANKMKEITLGKAAEEIVWNRNDEIGELVTQYNKMVHQLEQSAEALAKSEREGAWREMARQVAHEIKNPLTPMKLSIQYLQKAIQNNQPNVQVLTVNVANTLIEQIDHLSKIAADFSQFANIGNKKIEKMDLHIVLASLVDLYAANPNINLVWNKVDDSLFMRTDKTHMNRLFTNLLSNAVDACSERRACAVTINETKNDDYIIVSITDNGEGIPAEMQSKIFTPNFTTKTSGTGLGLAMCKSITEQAGGSIWFETEEGEGTTFFVQLPLAE